MTGRSTSFPPSRIPSAHASVRRPLATLGREHHETPRSTLETHGGFVIDWGAGTAGIQNPPNHRIRLLRGEFVHMGVAIDYVGYSSSAVSAR